MGMYPAQNYGADFVNAMAATSGMINDRKRLDLEERKQAADAQTRTLQNKGLELENQKKEADAAREGRLRSFVELSSRMQSGAMKPEDYGALAGVTSELMQETPYLPSDPAEIPRYKQAVGTLLAGVDSIRTLPAKDYLYSRDDNVPEVNTVLDSFQTLLSKERLGKEFVDQSGAITGQAGGRYRTAAVDGFGMRSGEGNRAAFVPLFSVVNAEGQPIVGADGRRVLVPATEGASNDPNARVRMITPEEMLTKAGYAYRVLDVAEKLGLADPQKRSQYINSNLYPLMGEEGAKKLLEETDVTPKLTSVDPTHDLVDAKGNVIRKGTPKKVKETPHTTTAGVGNDQKQTLQYNDETGRFDIPIGKPFATHAPKSGEGKEEKAKAKSVKELVDEFQALKQKRSAQWAADEREWRKANQERQAIGDKPLTWEEYFGGESSSSHQSLTQSMYQLRDAALKGYGYDLVNMAPAQQQAQPARAPQKGMAPPQTAAAPRSASQPAKQRPPLSSFVRN